MAEAFRQVLAEARPLADLLWMRETSGGVFDTPERKAELEKTLRDLTGRIRDESLRFHYAQEMRDRVQAFFGRARQKPLRAGEWDKSGQGTGAGRPVREARRGGEPLRRVGEPGRSAMVKRAGGVMPLREAAIVVALVNHPVADRREFRACRNARPVASRSSAAACGGDRRHGARRGQRPRRACSPRIEAAGPMDELGARRRLIRKARLWPVLEDAAIEDAREAFAQALHLHRSAGTLHKELKAAEMALATEPTDENYRHLVEIQTQFRDAQATEALIEGFGIPSGRAGGVSDHLIRFFNANHARGA